MTFNNMIDADELFYEGNEAYEKGNCNKAYEKFKIAAT
jgi:hypothetical protein